MYTPNICVVFSDTPEGRTALTFAADLKRRLGDERLNVYLGRDEACSLISGDGNANAADTTQKARVAELVAAMTQLTASEIEVIEFNAQPETIEFPEGAIVVDHTLSFERADINVLTPFDESTLDERGEGPLVIPFGDGDSGKVAALIGLRLAAAISRKVVFYHTTWRSESTSPDPRDHMCQSARNDQFALEGWASAVKVEHETVVEMAPDVTEGIIRQSVLLSASLIVTARGRKTKIGSYVSQMLNQSPLPILLVSACNRVTPPETVSPTPALSAKAPMTGKAVAAGQIGRDIDLQGAAASLRTAGGRMLGSLARAGDRLVEALPPSIGSRLGNPIFVMCVVGLMYIVKAIVKTLLGVLINSPMLTGDGLHNIADLFEAAAVIAVIYVSQRPPSERYAYGRKNIEFFTAGAIGIGLIGMSLVFLVKSLVGIISYFPAADTAVRSIFWLPAHEPLVMGGGHFPWVVAVTAGSVILSILVSRYQIRVGKKTGHDSLIADGEETMSDGRIELVALIGVLAEYAFHAPWIEYPLGLVIAFLIARTGKELWIKAWHVLLQHTIGVEHDQEIRRMLDSTRGVLEATEVKTFQVGRIAVLHLTVTTLRTAQTVVHIKYGIERAVERYVLAQDFTSCETHINFQPPSPKRHRQAVAIVRDGDTVTLAPSLEKATSLVVCDIELGRIVRATEEEAGIDPVSLLAYKRVTNLFQFSGKTAHEEALAQSGIELQAAPSYLPQAIGLPRAVMLDDPACCV